MITNKLSGKYTAGFNKFLMKSETQFVQITCFAVDEIVKGIRPLTYSFRNYTHKFPP